MNERKSRVIIAWPILLLSANQHSTRLSYYNKLYGDLGGINLITFEQAAAKPGVKGRKPAKNSQHEQSLNPIKNPLNLVFRNGKPTPQTVRRLKVF